MDDPSGVPLQEPVDDYTPALYEACLLSGPDKLWSQSDLLGLGIIPDDDVLLLNECINRLLHEHVFKQMKKDHILYWKVSTREEAAKYQHLTPDEVLVYSQIESAGRDGIWIKTIRTRTNLHQVPVNKALKTLEHKNLVKQIHANRAASRRIYMLASLQPHEEVSGGPFYSDGNIDFEYIRHSCYLLEKQIRAKSWQAAPGSGKRRRVSFDEGPPGKRPSNQGREREQHRKSAAPAHDPAPSKTRWLPMPAGYTGYPTLSHLTQDFNRSEISSVKLKEDEISQLLDILRWDGKIEKVHSGRAYRSVHPDRVQHGDEGARAFVEAPCGRCPVADFCNDEGPVNPDSCKYFDLWLDKKVDGKK